MRAFLARQSNGKLMVPHGCVEHNHPFAESELVEYDQITTWDGVCNDTSDPVQRNAVHAKVPDEVFNVDDMLLMGFGCK